MVSAKWGECEECHLLGRDDSREAKKRVGKYIDGSCLCWKSLFVWETVWEMNDSPFALWNSVSVFK